MSLDANQGHGNRTRSPLAGIPIARVWHQSGIYECPTCFAKLLTDESYHAHYKERHLNPTRPLEWAAKNWSLVRENQTMFFPSVAVALSDGNVRAIIDPWHAGLSSPSYRLLSTGAIPDPDALIEEIGECMQEARENLLLCLQDPTTHEGIEDDGVEYWRAQIFELVCLNRWAIDQEQRGPVAGWSDIEMVPIGVPDH